MLKSILKKIYLFCKLMNFERIWRKKNKHNRTHVNSIFPLELVDVGKGTYGKLNVHYYSSKDEHLKIGNYCSIAENVQFFTGGNHDYYNLSTYPFKNILTKNSVKEALTKGEIEICDDVWIGYGVIILSGVKIGKGSVIGAGSIVSKDIPPYSIYVGDRVIKKRFSDEIIAKLINIDFKSIDIDKLDDIKIEKLYTHLNKENIDDIIENVFNSKIGDKDEKKF